MTQFTKKIGFVIGPELTIGRKRTEKLAQS